MNSKPITPANPAKKYSTKTAANIKIKKQGKSITVVKASNISTSAPIVDSNCP